MRGNGGLPATASSSLVPPRQRHQVLILFGEAGAVGSLAPRKKKKSHAKTVGGDDKRRQAWGRLHVYVIFVCD